jgi:RNA polymerase sigma factor (sigma-70 family)
MSAEPQLVPAEATASAGDDRPSAGELKAAAVRLLTRHERTLRRTARRFSICADDADDAFQRALEILLTKAPTTRELDLLRWMQVVTKHEALAVRRQRERLVQQPPAPDGEELDLIDSFPTESAGPGERAERVERVERSREALGALKPHEAQALTMKAEGYSYAEIGSMTGWSYTKINRLMAEGRKRFFEVFRGIEQGERCGNFADLLQQAADGVLESGRLRELRQHVRSCGSCRAELRSLRGLPQGAFAWLAPVLLAWRAVASRAQHLGEIAVSQKAATAAVVVAAAAGGGVAVHRDAHDSSPPTPRIAPRSAAEPAPSPPAAAATPAAAAAPTKGSVGRHRRRPRPSPHRAANARPTPSVAPAPAAKPPAPRLPSGGSEEFGL